MRPPRQARGAPSPQLDRFDRSTARAMGEPAGKWWPITAMAGRGSHSARQPTAGINGHRPVLLLWKTRADAGPLPCAAGGTLEPGRPG
jgi:hypothetical protein